VGFYKLRHFMCFVFFTHLVMDRCKQVLLTCLSYQIFLYVICESISFTQQCTFLLHQQRMSHLFLVYHVVEHIRRYPLWTLWAHDKVQSFIPCTLFGSFNYCDSKNRMRMSRETFNYICYIIAPFMQKINTMMKNVICVKIQVIISISRLATWNNIVSITNLYCVGLSISQSFVNEFLDDVKNV